MSIIGKIVGVTYDCRTAAAKFEFYGQEIVRVVVPASKPVIQHRCDGIDCLTCWNAGVRYEDYLKNRELL